MERHIRNPHGITIRCCCATCQHKTLDRKNEARRCQKLLKPDLPTCPGYDPLGPQEVGRSRPTTSGGSVRTTTRY